MQKYIYHLTDSWMALPVYFCLPFPDTVMRIIKLKIFPVPVRWHSGNGKLIFVIITPFFAIFKKVVHNVLKYIKTF